MITITITIWESEKNSVMTKVDAPMTKATLREAKVAEAIFDAIREKQPEGTTKSETLYEESFMKPVEKQNQENQ